MVFQSVDITVSTVSGPLNLSAHHNFKWSIDCKIIVNCASLQQLSSVGPQRRGDVRLLASAADCSHFTTELEILCSRIWREIKQCSGFCFSRRRTVIIIFEKCFIFPFSKWNWIVSTSLDIIILSTLFSYHIRPFYRWHVLCFPSNKLTCFQSICWIIPE